MPNWCSNYVELTHDNPDMIRRAEDAFNRGELLAEFIPVPASLQIVAGRVGDDNDANQKALEVQQQENIALHGYANWYDFCVGEWGTKWDVGGDGQVPEINGNTFSASFQSAWGPPIQAFEKLEEMGFTVSAYYYEPGMGFCGMFAEGFDDYFDITDMDSDAVADLLPDVLDAMFNISEDIAMWEEENEDEDETPHEFSTEGKFTVEDGNIDIDINQTGGKW
jgi:hypothetical protein